MTTYTRTPKSIAHMNVAPLAIEPLGVDAKGIPTVLPIARSTWLKWQSAGLIPRPRRIGRRVLWDVAELRAWFAAGAPSREAWDEMKADRAEEA